MFRHVLDTFRPRGIISNEFLGLNNLYLHSKMMKIHQKLPKKLTLLDEEKISRKYLDKIMNLNLAQEIVNISVISL